MTDPRISLSIQDGIASVTLNRPGKRNALDMAMFEALDGCIKQLRRNLGLRAVIVRAAGEDFCSGLDIKSIMQSRKKALRLLWKWWPGRPNLAQRVVVGWHSIPVPVIMAIQGRCWGGGLQIALGADFRIAHPEASLSIMEARWGLIPDMGGTLALRNLLRTDQAMELAMSAAEIDAKQAAECGLVTRVADNPYTTALELAETFSQRSPDAIAGIKKLYQNHWQAPASRILGKETAFQWRVLLGKNQRIAVKKAQEQEANYQPRSKRW